MKNETANESHEKEMSFPEETARAYRNAVAAYREACDKSATGDQAVRRVRQMTAKALRELPIPGPDIKNWDPAAADKLADQYDIMAASYKEAATRYEHVATTMRRMNVFVTQLRDQVLKNDG